MPPKRRVNFGRQTPSAKRICEARANAQGSSQTGEIPNDLARSHSENENQLDFNNNPVTSGVSPEEQIGENPMEGSISNIQDQSRPTARKRYRLSAAERNELARNRRQDAAQVREQTRHERALLQEQETIAKQVGKGTLNSACMTKVNEFPEKYVNFHDCGPFTRVCLHCNALSWQKERASLCCKGGKVVLPPVPRPPLKLIELYDVNQSFLQKIRSYNNAFALASMGCKQIRFTSGVSCFKVQGKIHHFLGSLLPPENGEPKFAQLYFHDSDHEVSNRSRNMEVYSVSRTLQRTETVQEWTPGMEPQATAPNIISEQNRNEVIETLQEILHEHNSLVRSFKMAVEIESPDIQLIMSEKSAPQSEHSRRFNMPSSSEVAAILPGEGVGSLDIIVHRREGSLQRISTLHRLYDPLHYVIPFPFGTEGWKRDLFSDRGFKISQVDFYSFRLQVRADDDNLLMKSRRLLQQYAVDQWAKVQLSRLEWAEHNQKTIRAEKYCGLYDAQAAGDLANAGTKIILPPSVYGSPRFYTQAFQNAMTIVRKYGKPDFFITFTCNAQWPEIKAALFPGEQPSDRPDLCARVFKLKLDALLDDLLKKHVLGKVTAHNYTIEWQKRGLTHAHILLIMDSESKPRNPEMIDKVVSAELPDMRKCPKLFDIVSKRMIHGPCGNINRSSPCMTGEGLERNCSKEFPKPETLATNIPHDSFPNYRRRLPDNGGFSFEKNGFQIDNSWVVPYNPYLLLKYNAHLNVEVVHSVQAVKYLYKYINKGPDRIMVAMDSDENQNERNEVQDYVNARYISASEAFWRLYEYNIHGISPPVEKLPLHLPGEQSVLFEEGEGAAALERGAPETRLTAYFKLNQECEEARGILYPDIPSQFTWDAKNKKWKARQQRYSIGRVPTVSLSPHQSERYYLRMILHNKAGAKSFEDLRTINGETHPTFNAACRALGLLEDDSEIDKALDEAALIRFGDNLRDVFVTLLVNCMPANSFELWNRWRRTLCEDKIRQSEGTELTDIIESQVLIYIRDRLEREGHSLESFHLPQPSVEHLIASEHRIIREETEFDFPTLQQEVENGYPYLNAEQKNVFDSVMSSVDGGRGELFCLNASGGTGKTHTINLLLANIRSRGDIAIATATSGIAATLLCNGRTLHSRCHLPILIDESSVCRMPRNSQSAKLFNQAKLLIIDEVSMGHRHWYEAVDRTLQDVQKKPGIPFGGLTVLFSGDWKQILPVVKHGGRIETVDACLKQSYIWQHVTELTLSKNMRLEANHENQEFASYLIDLGNGRLPIFKELGDFKVKIPNELLHSSDDLSSLCAFVFESIAENFQNPSWLCSRAIIASTNDHVDQINSLMMEKFPGEQRVYKSCDVVTENEHQYPLEFINGLNPSGLPPHQLVLKKHSSIMLLRNLDPANGHCNGTRYHVDNLHDHIIEATVAYGAHAGKKLFIPRIPLKPTDFSYPFEMKRRQFPVKPAFAMTANKSQGQTLKRIGIFLSREMFSHGQNYVAQSRVTSKSDLKILAPFGTYPRKEGKYCNNVVWPEIL